MLMHDAEAALGETRRVLRPGGKVAFCVWASPEKNPFVMIPISLIQRGHMPPPDPPPAPGLFTMADPGRVTFPVPNADGYLESMADTAGPIAIAPRACRRTSVPRSRADVEDSLARFVADGDGYPLPGLALCAVAS